MINSESDYVAVLNPKAGKLSEEANFILLCDQIKEHSKCSVYLNSNLTRDQQQIEKLINSEHEHFIFAGGDGTLNYFVNLLLEKSENYKAKIILIPSGSGNDFARSLDIEKETIKKIIGLNNFSKLNIGKVQSTRNYYFVNMLGLGLDAEAVEQYNKKFNRGKLKGSFGYILALITALIPYKSVSAKLSIGSENYNVDLFQLFIGNAKFAGGGMKLCPGANPFDGNFEIQLVRKISKSKIVLNILKLFNGKYTALKEVKTIQENSILIKANPKLKVQVDGEAKGALKNEMIISSINSSISLAHR